MASTLISSEIHTMHVYIDMDALSVHVEINKQTNKQNKNKIFIYRCYRCAEFETEMIVISHLIGLEKKKLRTRQ